MESLDETEILGSNQSPLNLNKLTNKLTMIKLTTILFKNVKFPVAENVLMKRQATTLPVHLHEVMIGALLGDAGVYRTTKSLKSNSRLEFSFGQHREEFASWMYELFEDYAQTQVKPIMVNAVTGGPKVYKSFRFKTLSLPVFNYYRDLFYQLDVESGRYIKCIPDNIESLLTPLAMATFVMGDGNYQPTENTVRIYTNAFTHADVQRLAKAMTNRFGIVIGIRHDRKGQYILSIGSNDVVKFRELVTPYMQSSMLYRIQ